MKSQLFISFSHLFLLYTILNPLTVLFAPGCSISSPSMSQRYCCAVNARASSPVLGHLKLPASNRLYASTNPSPSQHSAFTLSLRRPQNRKSVFVNGSSSNFCCTSVARPSIPLRRSVYPTARNTRSADVKSLSITQCPKHRCCKRSIASAVYLYAGVPQLHAHCWGWLLRRRRCNLYKLRLMHCLIHLPLPAVVLAVRHAMLSAPCFYRHTAPTAICHQSRPFAYIALRTQTLYLVTHRLHRLTILRRLALTRANSRELPASSREFLLLAASLARSFIRRYTSRGLTVTLLCPV